MEEMPLQAKAVAQITTEINGFLSHRGCLNVDISHSVAFHLKVTFHFYFKVVQSIFYHMVHGYLSPTGHFSIFN